MISGDNSDLKEVEWLGDSQRSMHEIPRKVRRRFGYALFLAQQGSKHADAKPLRGFKGAGVLEVVQDYDGDAYRAVYTVRFQECIYVLHVFQKKSKHGIETPRADMQAIQRSLAEAQQRHEEWQQNKRS